MLRRWIAVAVVAAALGGCANFTEQRPGESYEAWQAREYQARMAFSQGMQNLSNQLRQQQLEREANRPQMFTCNSNAMGYMVTTNCTQW